MREVLRTNDIVRLSFLRAVLAEAGIEAIVLDEHMSVLEGSAAAIPRRVMVCEADESEALALIAAALSAIDLGG